MNHTPLNKSVAYRYLRKIYRGTRDPRQAREMAIYLLGQWGGEQIIRTIKRRRFRKQVHRLFFKPIASIDRSYTSGHFPHCS